MEYRMERDSMGEVQLPSEAWYGAQTQRAVENFGISCFTMPPAFLRALALVKVAAAEANRSIGALEPHLADAIIAAARSVAEGEMMQEFPVDVFQTGSGTSTNMNMNEVLANMANFSLGSERGSRSPVHPNDHVNKGQSSNDVIPTALHVANRVALTLFTENLKILESALATKAKDFHSILKLGRTHLQDAVPMTLGQEFDAFREQISKSITRMEACATHLEELAIGGTAVGSGLNCPKGFAQAAIMVLERETGIPFRGAPSRFEAIATRDAQVELMGALNTVAGSLAKIADDLRLLSSGPRGGLGEIELPALQPGSSIMPGKVNPVIPEMVLQAATFVRGQATAVGFGGSIAPLQLNMAHPLLAWCTLQSMEILGNASRAFAERCINGLKANTERAANWIESSLALVTPLALEIGYDEAARLAHEAHKTGKTIRQVVSEANVLPPETVEKLLNPWSMVERDEE